MCFPRGYHEMDGPDIHPKGELALETHVAVSCQGEQSRAPRHAHSGHQGSFRQTNTAALVMAGTPG
jgi:hypothetical protein